MLSDACRARLLEIARLSIDQYVKYRKKPRLEVKEPELLELGAAFVTLTHKGQLRGCIGYTEAFKPLYQTILDCAISAATGDPRFLPVTPDELMEIDIEISVLSPLKKVDDIEEIQVGHHGLMIEKGFRKGLLLPQVATEYGWDREAFLEHTCLKAGLPPDAWRKGAKIYLFSAEIFGERKHGSP